MPCPNCDGSITEKTIKGMVRFKCNDEKKKGCKANGYLRHAKAGETRTAPADVPVREVPEPKGGEGESKPTGGDEPKRGGWFSGGFDLD